MLITSESLTVARRIVPRGAAICKYLEHNNMSANYSLTKPELVQSGLQFSYFLEIEVENKNVYNMIVGSNLRITCLNFGMIGIDAAGKSALTTTKTKRLA
jgi:hypothetical protein